MNVKKKLERLNCFCSRTKNDFKTFTTTGKQYVLTPRELKNKHLVIVLKYCTPCQNHNPDKPQTDIRVGGNCLCGVNVYVG